MVTGRICRAAQSTLAVVAFAWWTACTRVAPGPGTSGQLLAGTAAGTLVQPFAEAIQAAGFTGKHPVEARVLCELEAATVQLVRILDAEQPHIHDDHDLIVTLLEGRGTMLLGEHEVEIARGDVVVIGRDIAHAFRNANPGGSVALVVRAPPAGRP